ncbi:MAG: glycosyltransferase family 39 protein [Anaerolineales bacterium]|nr:glycosyltransferase family 39 protein [Anaerolineales bacterium]
MTSSESEPNTIPESNPQDAQEPSVLDWLKSLVRGRPIPIPEGPVESAIDDLPLQVLDEELQRETILSTFRFEASQFRLPVALLLALAAQFGLERREGSIWVSIALYILAAVVIAWGTWSKDFIYKLPPISNEKVSLVTYRPALLTAALILSLLTFITSGNNLFNFPTMVFWTASVITILLAFWVGEFPVVSWWRRLKAWLVDPSLRLSLSGWDLLVLAGFGLSVYFRFYLLDSVPPEMVSDHAEKLLDVVDVVNGKYSIFFSRNTGREALQFYMAAATYKWLGTGISYLTLKIGTALAGIFTIPFIYLLGKEVGGKRVGLAAMILAGIAYWPNVISRVGLRFPLYPLFVAPAFYYLARGIRTRNRNDFLLCGLVVGMGLHGYSPTRVLPIAIAVGVGLYLLHKDSHKQRRVMITLLVVTGLVALIVLMPLVRIAIDRPDEVIYRMATRYGSTERDLPGPILQIFLSNVWNGLKMFTWDNGEVWVNSIPHRPALDWVTGALFSLGVVIALTRCVRGRRWIDLFILISIPILQLPSTLSLAFPGENPATNRAAGAIVPVFILAGLAFAAIPDWIETHWKGRRTVGISLVFTGLLLLIAGRLNFHLVFKEYQDLYRRSAWNTSEAGAVIRNFAESIGYYETAHVVAYPHWVDTRLVGINAGQPTRDYAISEESFADTIFESRPQLFLLHPDDEESLQKLKELHPFARVTEYPNIIEGKNFIILSVPLVPETIAEAIRESE